ncbi:tumor protein D54 isoform X2 [Nematostella vectensis]|uniref:tumor protein D54 isoform X2 n=1 Tax=Nematostella vectensis TaxID=45351 RepID=UPI00138FA753|nr:tumor protein D54 isoform X2 [Nematostella vectensis]
MAAEKETGSDSFNINEFIVSTEPKPQPPIDRNGEDIPLNPGEQAEEAHKEELRAQIRTIEEEITTLKQALARKENQLADLKRELGITAWSQIKEGLGNTYHGVQQSRAYQKTSESLKDLNEKIVHSEAYNKLSQGASATKVVLVDASEKTVSAVKTASSATAKKLGEIRQSNSFQSFESKLYSTTAAIKFKMLGGPPKNKPQQQQTEE